MYSRQAFKHEGKFVFWGGLALEAWGGGPGLVEGLFTALEKNGIDVAYEARGERLVADDDGVHGVVANVEGRTTTIACKAVVLAAGGFEANAEMRTRYLGPGWDLAKVRGTRFNTGGGIKMALDIGAMPYGNWSGCHAVGWDYNAPEFGDLAVGDNFQKHSYPFAIMVNATGERFCDEGADFRNYTYAKYGRLILEQPHQFAWQIFDQQVVHLQRDEYRIRQVTKVTADTIEELADKMAEYAPVDKAAFLKTVREYNDGGRSQHPVQPDRQGRAHDARPRDRQDELGDAVGEAAVRGVLHDLRCHVHVRRGADRHRRPRARHGAEADPRPVRGRRAGRRVVLLQLSGRHRAWCRDRCSARSPAPRPDGRSAATRERERAECKRRRSGL